MTFFRLDEDERAEYRIQDKQERYEADAGDMLPDACKCGAKDWRCTEQTVYGDDLDGNRGRPLWVWECRKCGDERQVVG